MNNKEIDPLKPMIQCTCTFVPVSLRILLLSSFLSSYTLVPATSRNNFSLSWSFATASWLIWNWIMCTCGKASVVECRLIPSIHPWLTLDGYLNWCSANTQSRIEQCLDQLESRSVMGRVSTDSYVSININGMSAKPTQLLTKKSIKCWSSVNLVSIEDHSRVSINTRPWMPLELMILALYSNTVKSQG